MEVLAVRADRCRGRSGGERCERGQGERSFLYCIFLLYPVGWFRHFVLTNTTITCAFLGFVYQSVVGYPTMKRDRCMYPGLVTSYSRLNYLYNTKKTNYGYTDLLLPTNYFPVSRLLDTKLQTKTLRHWVIKIHSDIIALDFKCSFKHANTRCFGNLGATG